jgi:hypothetical protein
VVTYYSLAGHTLMSQMATVWRLDRPVRVELRSTTLLGSRSVPISTVHFCREDNGRPFANMMRFNAKCTMYLLAECTDNAED